MVAGVCVRFSMKVLGEKGVVRARSHRRGTWWHVHVFRGMVARQSHS